MSAARFHLRRGAELPPFVGEPSFADQLAALRAHCDGPTDEVLSQEGAVIGHHCRRCGAVSSPEKATGQVLLFSSAPRAAGGAA